MHSHYVTFPFHDETRRNKYQEFVAENEEEARKAACQTFGKTWAFLYSEEQFARQIDSYRLEPLGPAIKVPPLGEQQ